MSGRNIFKSPLLKSGMIVGASVVALTLGACASGAGNSSRYGSVYDYESGGGSCNGGSSCGAVVSPQVISGYSSTTVLGGQPVSPGIIYTDCGQMVAVGCGAPYAPPIPVYTAPVVPVGCPIDTIMISDGTCVMITPPPSSVMCPSNTRQASDGTCMMIDDTPTVTIYPTTGYVPPVNYTAPVYHPIRK